MENNTYPGSNFNDVVTRILIVVSVYLMKFIRSGFQVNVININRQFCVSFSTYLCYSIVKIKIHERKFFDKN